MSVYLPVSQQKEQEPGETGPEENREKREERASDRPELSILAADDNPKVLGLLERDAERISVNLKGCMSMEEAEELLKYQEDVYKRQHLTRGSAPASFSTRRLWMRRQQDRKPGLYWIRLRIIPFPILWPMMWSLSICWIWARPLRRLPVR